mgnify:CR=1 FL=1
MTQKTGTRPAPPVGSNWGRSMLGCSVLAAPSAPGGGVNQGRVVVAPREVQGSVPGLGDQDHDSRREGRAGVGHRGGICEAVPEASGEDPSPLCVSGHGRAGEDNTRPLEHKHPRQCSGAGTQKKENQQGPLRTRC